MKNMYLITMLGTMLHAACMFASYDDGFRMHYLKNQKYDEEVVFDSSRSSSRSSSSSSSSEVSQQSLCLFSYDDEREPLLSEDDECQEFVDFTITREECDSGRSSCNEQYSPSRFIADYDSVYGHDYDDDCSISSDGSKSSESNKILSVEELRAIVAFEQQAHRQRYQGVVEDDNL